MEKVVEIKNLCYIVQGVTFLKTMMPLIIFSNKAGIKPFIFFVKTRSGKDYDSLYHRQKQVQSIIKEHGVNCDYQWFDNQAQVLKYMKSKNLSHIVCQDAHNHGRIFCEDQEIKVYSIGVFFDTLHHANDLKTSRVKYKSYPDRVYVPNNKFKDAFLKLCKQYDHIPIKSLGSPLYDHSLFLNVEKSKRLVTFLVTQQSLLSEKTQSELEDFIHYCGDNNIDVIVKTKPRTPWRFLDSTIHNKVSFVEEEKGFPSTSMSLILNSDVVISSYSTVAAEAEYFGVPCINLESVEESKLTYAVRSIKHVYGFQDVFNSETCITTEYDIKSAFEKLCNLRKRKENLDIHPNISSLNILKDIRAFL